MKTQEFGARLRELRKQAGLSQRELADKVGVNFTYLSKIESGAMPPPSEKVILKLVEVLNADKDELMTLARKIPPDIAQMLTNRETLQFLRAHQPREKSRSDNKKEGINIIKATKHLIPRKSFPRVAIAIVSVCAIAASLWFASPVRALNISFPSPPSSGNLGSTTSFTVKIDISDAELLPIQSVNLYIYKTDARATYEATCSNLPLITTVTPFTTITATGTSGTSGTVSITAAAPNWQYLYGYGYAVWQGYGYRFFPPGGYGYGYGYGGGTATITYNVTWTSPSSWPASNYRVEAEITANSTTFTQASGQFALTTATAAVGGLAPPAAVTPEDIEELTTEEAAETLAELAPEEAAAIIAELVTEEAVAIMEELATEEAVAIMEELATEKAVAIMEELTSDTLTDTISEMSETSLTETLPGLSTDTLYSIEPEVLFESLPNAPTEQLVSEEPPQPPAEATAPIVVYTTPSGATYLAIQTWTGEWAIVMATPPPLEQLLIKTNRALTDVQTTVEILEEQPPEVAAGLPAGQIVLTYINISFENAAPEDIALGHLTFRVEKEWLEQNSVHKWSVVLNRYDSQLEQWITLPTKRVKEDDSDVYYTATITHFSTFAISGSQTVPALNFKAADLIISPADAETGQEVIISADITSLSDTAGTYAVTLWIDDTVEAGKDISLEAGETKPVSFTVVRDAEGSYEVRLDRLFSSFSVTKSALAPAAFTASDLTISPAKVDTGESVTISVLVTNTGDLTDAYEVTLKIANVVEETKDITLAGGASQKVTFTTAKGLAGTYTVNINGLSGTFTVTTVINWWLIGGIIATVIIISITILLIARRRPA